MGKIKYLSDIRSIIDDNIVFSINDIKRIILSKGGNPDYAKLLLYNLESKGVINRVIKGYYSRYDDPNVITYCIKPSYVGLESALSFYNIWEQETNVVLITTRRIRTGTKKVFGANVVIHSIDDKYFFGFDHIDYYDLKIPISDIEKTFIDCIYYNRYLSKETLKNIYKKIDKVKLKRYLKRYDHRFIKKIKQLI